MRRLRKVGVWHSSRMQPVDGEISGSHGDEY
jgi:hypothetical protein